MDEQEEGKRKTKERNEDKETFLSALCWTFYATSQHYYIRRKLTVAIRPGNGIKWGTRR